MKLDYKTLTLKQMMDYIEENHNDAPSKKAFASVAIKEQKEQITVDVLDEDGKPVTYTDKKGAVKTKKQRVDKPDGKLVKTKDVFGAKRYFYDTYKNEIEFENAPKAKVEDTILDKLLSW